MMDTPAGEDMKLRIGWAGLGIATLIATATACDAIDRQVALKKATQLYKEQKYEEAIVEYQKILATHPSDWEANYRIAVSYLALYHPGSQHEKDLRYSTEGIKAFEKLLTLTPPDEDARAKTRGYYLGLLDAAQKPDKAVAFLEAELAKKPDDSGLINQIADLYQKAGDFPNSLKYFQKAADLNSGKKEAWYTLGVACWSRSYHGGMMVAQDEREQVVATGLAAFDKAVSIDPEYFDALWYINLTYREKAKADAAVGRSQEASDDILKAEEYMKRALEIKKKQQAAATAKVG